MGTQLIKMEAIGSAESSPPTPIILAQGTLMMNKGDPLLTGI